MDTNLHHPIQENSTDHQTKDAPSLIEDTAAAGNTGPSEDAIALEFSDRHGADLRYVPAWGRWLRWDGCRWALDDTLRVFDLVRAICRAKARAGDRSGARLASASTIAAVERLARSDRRHVRRADDFDADPWVLNTPGGVIDLRTGALRPHCSNDNHSKAAGATPGGACPRWLEFLSEITQGDSMLVEYLQRWAGYTLTGLTREHGFMFTWGPGGNGKSVLLGTLAAALGDYATSAMAELFVVTRNEQHPTNLAALRGARMVIVTETEEGRAWAESRIKSLTGGDRISARVMRGDPFEFTPQFKLWIAGNHRPVLRNPDAAMQRRLHLVPMNFVPPSPDGRLAEALRVELPGILAWAVRGCLAWQKSGLCQPDAVRAAVLEYFAEQDSLGAWFSDRIDSTAGAETAARALFRDWTIYAKARQEDPGSEKRFSEGMQRRAPKKRGGNGWVYLGIKFRGSP